MPPSYSKGDMLCAKCHIWILANNVSTNTRMDKKGHIIHDECGYRVRTKSRRFNNMESVREDARRNKPISLGHSVRQDIELEREKWAVLIKGKA